MYPMPIVSRVHYMVITEVLMEKVWRLRWAPEVMQVGGSNVRCNCEGHVFN